MRCLIIYLSLISLTLQSCSESVDSNESYLAGDEYAVSDVVREELIGDSDRKNLRNNKINICFEKIHINVMKGIKNSYSDNMIMGYCECLTDERFAGLSTYKLERGIYNKPDGKCNKFLH